eukprot:scaffold57383_cov39-Phaeocystis_antarctica.AAC.1
MPADLAGQDAPRQRTFSRILGGETRPYRFLAYRFALWFRIMKTLTVLNSPKQAFKVTPIPVVKKGYSAALWWVPKGLLCLNLDFWHVKHGEKVLCLGVKSVWLRWRLATTHVATFRGRTATNLVFW